MKTTRRSFLAGLGALIAAPLAVLKLKGSSVIAKPSSKVLVDLSSLCRRRPRNHVTDYEEWCHASQARPAIMRLDLVMTQPGCYHSTWDGRIITPRDPGLAIRFDRRSGKWDVKFKEGRASLYEHELRTHPDNMGPKDSRHQFPV